MRLKHRIPRQAHENRAPEIPDDRYEAEIAKSLRHAEKAWKKAQAALDRADRVVERSATAEALRRRDELRLAVLTRLDELRQVEVLMQRAPVTGQNRSGCGSVRNPLPKGSKL